MALTAYPIRRKAVNQLTYCVKDGDRALRFWEDVLGLKQIQKQVDAQHLYWLQLPSRTMVHLAEHEDAPSTPSHHGAFEVDDIEAAQKSVRDRGVETTEVMQRYDG